jgi:hypothetical protein
MPHAEKWIPSPWNKRELELRRIKDAKNKRERKRKDKKQDGELLAAAELWTAEAVDEQHDVSAEPEQGPFYMCFLFTKYIKILLFPFKRMVKSTDRII